MWTNRQGLAMFRFLSLLLIVVTISGCTDLRQATSTAPATVTLGQATASMQPTAPPSNTVTTAPSTSAPTVTPVPATLAEPKATASPSTTIVHITATPTLEATITPTRSPHIIRFTVSPEAVYPGDIVTLTWELDSDVGQVNLYTMEQWGSLSADLGPFTERTGMVQVTTNPDLRMQQEFVLHVTLEATAHIKVSLLCPDPWLFSNPPQDKCPIWTIQTTVVSQRFERGWLLWTEADRNIYVLPDGGTWTDLTDLWEDGMPESDPDMVPPEGLLQPVRGFGLAWRQSEVYLSGEKTTIRSALGWATEPEQVVGEGFVQQAFTYGKHILGGDRFMTGPQGAILYLSQGLMRFNWAIWEG